MLRRTPTQPARPGHRSASASSRPRAPGPAGPRAPRAGRPRASAPRSAHQATDQRLAVQGVHVEGRASVSPRSRSARSTGEARSLWAAAPPRPRAGALVDGRRAGMAQSPHALAAVEPDLRRSAGAARREGCWARLGRPVTGCSAPSTPPGRGRRAGGVRRRRRPGRRADRHREAQVRASAPAPREPRGRPALRAARRPLRRRLVPAVVGAGARPGGRDGAERAPARRARRRLPAVPHPRRRVRGARAHPEATTGWSAAAGPS